MSSYRILKMESITSAPVLITGRSSRRLTASVVAVVLCPTSLAISFNRDTLLAHDRDKGATQFPGGTNSCRYQPPRRLCGRRA